MPKPTKETMPKFARLPQFIEEYQKLQSDTLDQVTRENRVVLKQEDYEAAEERLEELMEMDEWDEQEMLELIALVFGIAYANRMQEKDND